MKRKRNPGAGDAGAQKGSGKKPLSISEITDQTQAPQGGALRAILEANLRRATEPELIARLRAAIDRLAAS